MDFVEHSMLVQPRISSVNQIAERAKKVAVTGLRPIFESLPETSEAIENERRRLLGFRLNVEGPRNQVSYFRRMMDEANMIARFFDTRH